MSLIIPRHHQQYWGILEPGIVTVDTHELPKTRLDKAITVVEQCYRK